ncbi:hypothetical protein BHE74_00006398 [Ensete ventricosum]|nr:hypothetical protein BHE74_00006398 [Ensete ventricosum]
MNRPATIKPLASPAANRTSQPKELTREKLQERSAKRLFWHYDEPWSRDNRCKRRKLLVIESIEDPKPKHVDPEPEKEDAEEEPQSTISTIYALAVYANPQSIKVDGFLEHQPITILIDTGSTNNFMDSKVVARLTLPIEDYSRFDVKVADGRILNSNRKSPQMKLVLQGQEITADFFLPFDDYQAVLNVEWLSTLCDVS